MKSTFLYIIMLLCFVSTTAQQNLIPNPSFEEYWSCPLENELGQGEFNKCKHWWYPHSYTLGTPDYFNRCNNSSTLPYYGVVGVPNNFWGHQEAFDGDAYVGLLPLEVYQISKKGFAIELISCKLLERLKPCYSYHFSMRINLANYSSHSLKKIGVLLTKDSVKIDSISELITKKVSWENNVPLYDTVQWMNVTGVLTANGNEEYLTIGYFNDYDDSEWKFNDSIINISYTLAPYYYIDSVSLTELGFDADCSIRFPNVVTPNGDGVNDYISIAETSIDKLIIYNRWGNVITVLTNEFPVWNGQCKAKNCSEGVYYYIATKGDKLLKKGTIQLIR